jgi:hypothetical protein
MDRADIIRLLPCYRIGQLEPEAADQVRRALHHDPSLRELLSAIQNAERLCAATLRQGAPAVLRPLPEPLSRLDGGWAWAGGLVAAAALVLLVVLGQGHVPAPGALAPLEDLLVAARIGDHDLIAARDPGSLSQKLRTAGVTGALTQVADLRSLGLTLEGALVRGDQVAVVWRDDRGTSLLCVMGPALAVYRTPDVVHRPDTGTGPVLQGHQLQGFAAIYWERDDLGCALVSAGELDALAAVAFRAVWSPVG